MKCGRRVLLFSPEPKRVSSLLACLKRRGDPVASARSVEDALRKARSGSFEVVFADLAGEADAGLALIHTLREIPERPQAIAAVPASDLAGALAAVRKGASDYLTLPVEEAELAYVMTRAIQRQRFERQVWAADYLVKREGVFPDLIGKSPATAAMRGFAEKASRTNLSILLLGETGTGKDLLARLVHRRSDRSGCPFVTFNCAGVPADLHTAQLFGYEKGGLTRSAERVNGILEVADTGTLFLDEVEALHPASQAGLLRAVENQEVRRVGGTATFHVNVRVVAAASRDLGEEVRAGRFRKDLYYRLNGLVFRVPSLRERARDIPVLARYFLERLRGNAAEPVFAKDALFLLRTFPWPGNVRELRNAVERLILTVNGDTITAAQVRSQLAADPARVSREGFSEESMERVERAHIQRILDRYRWNKTQAARVLGISLRNLYQKIDRYRLKPSAAKSTS